MLKLLGAVLAGLFIGATIAEVRKIRHAAEPPKAQAR